MLRFDQEQSRSDRTAIRLGSQPILSFDNTVAMVAMSLVMTFATGCHPPPQSARPPQTADPASTGSPEAPSTKVANDREAESIARSIDPNLRVVPQHFVRADGQIHKLDRDVYRSLVVAVKERREREDAVELVPIRRPGGVPLVTLQFELNSGNITSSLADNKSVLDWLRKTKLSGEGAHVQGHACVLGEEGQNVLLGRWRARATARAAFKWKDLTKVSIESCSSSRPVDAARLERNRRAEVYVPDLVRIETLVAIRDGNGEPIIVSDPSMPVLPVSAFSVSDGSAPVRELKVAHLGNETQRIREVDAVVIVDTSGSMVSELPQIPAQIEQVKAAWIQSGFDVRFSLYRLENCAGPPRSGNEWTTLCDGTFRGVAKSPGTNEDWGPATTYLASAHKWRSDAVRLIIPISDELPYEGTDSSGYSLDVESIHEAIAASRANDVLVFPLNGDYESYSQPDQVEHLMRLLAESTGGVHQYYKMKDGLPHPMGEILRWVSATYRIQYLLERPEAGQRTLVVGAKGEIVTPKGNRPVDTSISVPYSLSKSVHSDAVECTLDGPSKGTVEGSAEPR